MRKLLPTILIALAASGAAPVLATIPERADADPGATYGDDYASGEFGRVLYQENGLTLRRSVTAPGVDADTVDVNAPVYPADTAVTGYDQRAEVQLAGGTLVRLDRATEMTFLALPSPYAAVADNTVLQLASGIVRITAVVREGSEFRIDTPGASIYLVEDGDFRVEVDDRGGTRLAARRGVAELSGSGGSVLVRGGTTARVDLGDIPSDPEPFNTFVSDSFDRWVDARDEVYRPRDRYAGASEGTIEAEVYEELPVEVRPHYRELSVYGDWSYSIDYGYVWTPYHVPSSWRPYYDGYWSYGPHGYFWVSYEPWGWAPYHYGRWVYTAHRWCWVPGRVFAGAWVAWSWGSAYVGWCALDYWGYPAYATPYAHTGYYAPHAWTFVHYDHIHHRKYPRYAVSVHDVRNDGGRDVVVSRPPRVSPHELASSKGARERAVREVASNESIRVRPVDPANRTARSVREIEADIERAPTRVRPRTERGGAAISPRYEARVETPRAEARSEIRAPRSTPSGGDRRGASAAPPKAPRRLPSAAAEPTPGSDRSRAPRRLTPGGRDSGSERSDTGTQAVPRPRVKPRGESSATNERMRDLYRRLAGSSRSGERPAETPSAGRSEGSSPSRSRATAPARGGSAPKPGSRATTPSRGGSRPGEAPAAKPRSEGRKPSSSSARSPSKERTSRPTKAAPRSSSRSGSRGGDKGSSSRGSGSRGRKPD